MSYQDKKWKGSLFEHANISIEAEISTQSLSVGFLNEDISEDDCDRLANVAERVGLHPERGRAGKGRQYIYIRYYLVGDSTKAASTDVAFEVLKASLKRIRNFVRKYYHIGQAPRKGTKSRRGK